MNRQPEGDDRGADDDSCPALDCVPEWRPLHAQWWYSVLFPINSDAGDQPEPGTKAPLGAPKPVLVPLAAPQLLPVKRGRVGDPVAQARNLEIALQDAVASWREEGEALLKDASSLPLSRGHSQEESRFYAHLRSAAIDRMRLALHILEERESSTISRREIREGVVEQIEVLFAPVRELQTSQELLSAQLKIAKALRHLEVNLTASGLIPDRADREEILDQLQLLATLLTRTRPENRKNLKRVFVNLREKLTTSHRNNGNHSSRPDLCWRSGLSPQARAWHRARVLSLATRYMDYAAPRMRSMHMDVVETPALQLEVGSACVGGREVGFLESEQSQTNYGILATTCLWVALKFSSGGKAYNKATYFLNQTNPTAANPEREAEEEPGRKKNEDAAPTETRQGHRHAVLSVLWRDMPPQWLREMGFPLTRDEFREMATTPGCSSPDLTGGWALAVSLATRGKRSAKSTGRRTDRLLKKVRGMEIALLAQLNWSLKPATPVDFAEHWLFSGANPFATEDGRANPHLHEEETWFLHPRWEASVERRMQSGGRVDTPRPVDGVTPKRRGEYLRADYLDGVSLSLEAIQNYSNAGQQHSKNSQMVLQRLAIQVHGDVRELLAGRGGALDDLSHCAHAHPAVVAAAALMTVRMRLGIVPLWTRNLRGLTGIGTRTCIFSSNVVTAYGSRNVGFSTAARVVLLCPLVRLRSLALREMRSITLYLKR